MPKTTTKTQVSFSQEVQKKIRDPESAAHAAVAKALEGILVHSTDTQSNSTLEEICRLNRRVKEIDSDFQKISASLLQFELDKKKFRDEKGRVSRPYREWKKLHERYKEILEKSQHNALAAASVMRAYREAVLTDFKHEDIEDIKEELTNFLEDVDNQSKQALDSQMSFKSLAEDVRIFAKVIEETLERADARISISLQNARKKLKQLEAKLKGISDKIHAMGVACMSHFATCAGSVTATIFTLNPATLVVAVKSFVDAVTAGQEYVENRLEKSKTKKDIDKLKAEIAEHMEKEALLKKYQRPLEAARADIRTLADQLDAVTGIWRALKADMQMLHEEVRLVIKGKRITSRFARKLGTARQLYTYLSDCLEAYGKELDSVASINAVVGKRQAGENAAKPQQTTTTTTTTTGSSDKKSVDARNDKDKKQKSVRFAKDTSVKQATPTKEVKKENGGAKEKQVTKEPDRQASTKATKTATTGKQSSKDVRTAKGKQVSKDRPPEAAKDKEAVKDKTSAVPTTGGNVTEVRKEIRITKETTVVKETRVTKETQGVKEGQKDATGTVGGRKR